MRHFSNNHDPKAQYHGQQSGRIECGSRQRGQHSPNKPARSAKAHVDDSAHAMRQLGRSKISSRDATGKKQVRDGLGFKTKDAPGKKHPLQPVNPATKRSKLMLPRIVIPQSCCGRHCFAKNPPSNASEITATILSGNSNDTQLINNNPINHAWQTPCIVSVIDEPMPVTLASPSNGNR